MVQTFLISAAAFIFCAQPEPRPFWANAEGGPLRHDPFQALLQRPPAPSPFLGISGATSNAARPRRRQRGPKPSPPPPIAAGKYVYTFKDGFLPVGSDLGSLHITQPLQAAKACAALIACHGFTFSHAGPNGTVNTSNPFPTRALLKGGSTGTTTFNNDHGWVSWIKAAAKVSKPALSLTFDGINIALREDTFAVQWINASGANYSFTPPLTPATALPLIQHLGDMTMRVRAAAGEGAANDDNKQPPWRYFATAWGAMSAKATALPLNPSRRERASHDVTPLLAATNASILLQPSMRLPAPPSEWHGAPPLRVTRAYRDPKKTSSSSSSAGFELTFTLTNVVTHAIEIGSFGMATPAAGGGAGTLKKNVAIDAHIGGDHGWVEWVRVVVDERCMIATPLLSASSTRSSLEAWRPIFEFGGGGVNEWTTHSAAWATEWEENLQWPFLYMQAGLNATGIWPHPKSPWPSWGDGGATVVVPMTNTTHWNPPTSKVLKPGESVTYGMRFTACTAGPRTRDAALKEAGEPVLRAVPGYTLSTEMTTARLFATPASGAGAATVTGAFSSNTSVLQIAKSATTSATTITFTLKPVGRGRARIDVTLSDGSTARAQFTVLPPFTTQHERLAKHWSTVAWLPADGGLDGKPDPWGRGASVMPWDREDKRIRFNDGRAYDVGLSDDAGAASNLGLASVLAFAAAPGTSTYATAVKRLDEYVAKTLYGVKPGIASAPLKSLQLPDPDNGIRMTLYYYCLNVTEPGVHPGDGHCAAAPYWPWDYSEQNECGDAGTLNYNWCMTELQANATYRGFNYPHQIATYYALYRVARDHPRLAKTLPLRQTWAWYLARAGNTTVRLGYATLGYMDGTICREVLHALAEERDAAADDQGSSDSSSLWSMLHDKIERGEKGRAAYFARTEFPYGSEFAYDTTGQEEVVVWQLEYPNSTGTFDATDATAKKTVDHILSYMRHLPNWAYMGGALSGDVANGGKWLASAGTGVGDLGKMHYRSGLNQIALMEWYRLHPDDTFILEVAIGAMAGQLTNIDATGAPAIYFHAYPHVMEHDAYSGDYGLGFFGISLYAASTFVLSHEETPLCYLCDLATTEETGGSSATDVYTIVPRDMLRRRVYLEPLGLLLQADSGVLKNVKLDLGKAGSIVVTFKAPLPPMAGQQTTFDVLRLRAEKMSRPGLRPGSNFTVVTPATGVRFSRGAFEIPPSSSGETVVTLKWR